MMKWMLSLFVVVCGCSSAQAQDLGSEEMVFGDKELFSDEFPEGPDGPIVDVPDPTARVCCRTHIVTGGCACFAEQLLACAEQCGYPKPKPIANPCPHGCGGPGQPQPPP